jgi:threonine dehydrogenase-like Zn-dependent dehydrogenase
MSLSAIWEGPGSIVLESRPEPVAGPGEIIVSVGASGLCGTDIHIVDGAAHLTVAAPE